MTKSKGIRKRVEFQVGDIVGRYKIVGPRFRERNATVVLCECLTCGTVKTQVAANVWRTEHRKCRCATAFSDRGGKSDTREYKIWVKMFDRCYKESNINYAFYGGRGHYICQRWRESFDAFLDDVGTAPSKLHTIDRIDTFGSYTCGQCDECQEKSAPMNCQWATKSEQSRNRRNGLYVSFHGEQVLLCDLADQFGIKYHTLYNRVVTRGLTPEAAVTFKRRATRSA